MVAALSVVVGVVGCGTPASLGDPTVGAGSAGGSSVTAEPVPAGDVTGAEQPPAVVAPSPPPARRVDPPPATPRPRVVVPVTPAPAPPAPPLRLAPSAPSWPAVPRQTYSGTGDDVVTLTAPVGVAILAFDCPACTRNVAVKSDDDLLVNTIGGYSGLRVLGMRGSRTTRLEVTAVGAWTATVGGLDLAKTFNAGTQVTGSGDQVVVYRPSPTTVRLTHAGERNFAVLVLPVGARYPDLVVNTVGAYDGAVRFDAAGSDAVLVEVTADGAWTMTPRA